MLKSESEVQKEIIEYLSNEPFVVWAARINSSKTVKNYGGKARVLSSVTIYPKTNELLFPDIIGQTKDGLVFMIETKNSAWTPTSVTEREEKQEQMLYLCNTHGGRGGFASSLDDAMAIINYDR